VNIGGDGNIPRADQVQVFRGKHLGNYEVDKLTETPFWDPGMHIPGPLIMCICRLTSEVAVSGHDHGRPIPDTARLPVCCPSSPKLDSLSFHAISGLSSVLIPP
jgi:hypothetical protein